MVNYDVAVSGIRRIRQQAWQRVDAEAFFHAQGTPEHGKRLPRTGPVLKILRVGGCRRNSAELVLKTQDR